MRQRALLLSLIPSVLAGVVSLTIQPIWADADLDQYQQRLGQLFRQLDRNADGRLERDEVRANAYLWRHFDRLDRGSKGYLTPRDLR